MDQIAAILGLYTTDPGNNPVEEVLRDIESYVQNTGRSTSTSERSIMKISKYERGFKVQHGNAVSFPWYPQWYLKWLYPYAILRAAKLVYDCRSI